MEKKPIWRKTLDFKELDAFLKAGALQSEICDYFGIDDDTLRRRIEIEKGCTYSDYSRSLSSEGKIVLRKAQHDKALDGDTKLLIWLGKVLCGQREESTLTHLAPNQTDIDKTHEIIALQHEINILKERLNLNDK